LNFNNQFTKCSVRYATNRIAKFLSIKFGKELLLAAKIKPHNEKPTVLPQWVDLLLSSNW